jgi:nucleotide-binding universal stress UspA family protein
VVFKAQMRRNGRDIKKILVSTRSEEGARATMSFARPLAIRFGAELHVVVFTYPRPYPSSQIVDIYRNTFLEIRQDLLDLPTRVRQAVIVGKAPAFQLLLYVQQHGIDHVVIEHSNREEISDEERLAIRYVPCALTIIEPDLKTEPYPEYRRSERSKTLLATAGDLLRSETIWSEDVTAPP